MTTSAPSHRTGPRDPDHTDAGRIAPRRAALIAGVGYVVLFVLAIFANFVVREGLVETGDAAATAANIADSEGLFRLAMAAFLIIFALDIVVAWALYIVFRSAGRDLSALTAWLRLMYTVLLGVALIFLFQALQLVVDSDALEVVPTAQREAQALVALESFNAAWMIGLAVFGAHLVLLGHLARRSGLAPRGLGLILMVAGAAYVIDTLALTLMPGYDDHATLFTAMVAVPAVIAEGWFGLWLLLRAWVRPESGPPAAR